MNTMTKKENDYKTNVTISLSASTREHAKELADDTGMALSHIIESLLNGKSIEEIKKEAKKKNK